MTKGALGASGIFQMEFKVLWAGETHDERGLGGLRDLPRSGRPRRIPRETIEQIINKTVQPKRTPAGLQKRIHEETGTKHAFHTSRHPASRDQCEARDIHACRTSSHVVVRAPARLPPRPARGADRPTPASPIAGAAQRTPPTTRQALLAYSHVKCLSSRLTVT